jgi:hypothetical protein
MAPTDKVSLAATDAMGRRWRPGTEAGAKREKGSSLSTAKLKNFNYQLSHTHERKHIFSVNAIQQV